MRILIRIQVRLGLHLDPDLRVKKIQEIIFQKRFEKYIANIGK